MTNTSALAGLPSLVRAHYQALHSSRYFAGQHGDRPMPNATRYAETLVRLPLFADLPEQEVDRIASAVRRFFGSPAYSGRGV